MAVALVSGANRGIGREIARQLREDHGFLVLAGARDPTAVGAGERLVPVELNVSDGASVEQARQEIEREPGGLDVLVNNAGV